MLRFAKYHGLGNDFVLLDAAALPSPITPERARALCERHTGIGADGVLLREPPSDPRALCRMVVYNADGSRPQMCGNGLRCFALWLVDEGLAGDPTGELLVETDAGLRPCRLSDDGRLVTIAMGVPRLDRAALPMTGSGPAVEVLEVDGARLRLRGVSMGNPHAVVQVDTPTTRAQAERFGPVLVAHPLFPERTNVELAYVREDGSVELTVYERGVGITQACGTGAVATVAALAADLGEGFLARDVAVDLPGGRLSIHIERAADGAQGQSWLTGPAVRVFAGTLTGSGPLVR